MCCYRNISRAIDGFGITRKKIANHLLIIDLGDLEK